ncbi:MAG TPA: sulfur oxidation c-type cytochrome SoxX [Hyphomicrobiales bacterium]|nr:sulfur oxidation c-type cytochrome SoxX [Hyphomicrobiales bacterium]
MSLKLRVCAGLCAALGFLWAGDAPAQAAECRTKTAGFFLQYIEADKPHRLPTPSQSILVSLTGKPGDPERGRAIFVDRQKGDCLSCHKVTVLSPVAEQGSIGPPLDRIGSRYSEGQLRQIVVDPKIYFPDTMMPSYYGAAGSAEPSVLTAAEVEDLIVFMKTLK